MEQPIKFLTVVMKEATSTMDYRTRKLTNKVGHAIVLNDLGHGEIQQSTSSKDEVKPIVGVMMESFPQALCQTKILTQGIASMPAAEQIQPGDKIYAYNGKAHNANIVNSRYNPYVGIAINGAEANGWVSVLIK